MAEAITKAELKKLPIIPYDKIRPFLKTGDLFFSSGSYLFSRAIQNLTKSVWSHVAVVYVDQELGRVMLLEAEPYIGIRLIPLSKYIKDYNGKRRPYKGQIVVAQLKEPIPKENLNRGISFGLDELTRPYDNYEIARIMVRILLRISRREKNRAYICSELVRDILAKSGVVIHYNDTYISPEEVYKDHRIQVKYRIL